jgi:hypothetical protein
LEPVLEWLGKQALNFVLVYVCAPYDVPFNRFGSEPAAAARWNAHVITELLEPWPALPYFLGSFSGGAALALNGLQRERRCFGGSAFGADAIPPDCQCPEHWADKLQLYTAPHDRVSNHPANRQLTKVLEAAGQAEDIELPSGGHRLADYARPDCLGDLICSASRLAPGIMGIEQGEQRSN